MPPNKFSEIELWLMYISISKQHLDSTSYIHKHQYTTNQFQTNATIHSIISPMRNKNALLLLSGSSRLEKMPYIIKTIDDLNIDNSHDIFMYENKKQLNFLCTDNITEWIQSELQPIYDTLTIIGFSNGGIIASNVMYRLENAPTKSDFIKKQLITVDSLNDMFHFLKHYETNMIYRMDIMGCYIPVFMHSMEHFHLYDRINLLDIFKNTTLETMLQYLKRMYDIDTQQLQSLTTREYRLRNCPIVNIFSHYDPIIQSYYNEIQYENIIQKIEIDMPDIRSNIINIEFDMITHCSQMFDPKRTDEFVNLLRQHLCT